MDMSVLKRYCLILKSNLKSNAIPHILLSILMLAVTPLLFGIENLDQKAVWMPLEMFAALIGIILLTPVFLPEQNPEIEDTVAAKYTSLLWVYLLRILYSIVAVILLVAFFCLFLKSNHCDLNYTHLFGTIADTIFLGSIGTLASAASNNIAVSYMMPVIYYAINYSGGSRLGHFYLFSGMSGNYNEKPWLIITGVLLLILSLIIKKVIQLKR